MELWQSSQAHTIVVCWESPLYCLVTLTTSRIDWQQLNIQKHRIVHQYRRVHQFKMSKHRSSNSVEWHVGAPGNDTPIENPFTLGLGFCGAEAIFSGTNCHCLLSGKTDWIHMLLICVLRIALLAGNSNTAFTAVTYICFCEQDIVALNVIYAEIWDLK